MTKTVLGHIDCPACGMAHGMSIFRDKNGDPFGFCDGDCRQQLRIGPDTARVKKFVARYPWAAREPATVTGEKPVEKPVTVTGEKPAAPPVTDTPREQRAKPGPSAGPAAKNTPPAAPKQEPRRATVFDALAMLGGR